MEEKEAFYEQLGKVQERLPKEYNAIMLEDLNTILLEYVICTLGFEDRVDNDLLAIWQLAIGHRPPSKETFHCRYEWRRTVMYLSTPVLQKIPDSEA